MKNDYNFWQRLCIMIGVAVVSVWVCVFIFAPVFIFIFGGDL